MYMRLTSSHNRTFSPIPRCSSLPDAFMDKNGDILSLVALSRAHGCQSYRLKYK